MVPAPGTRNPTGNCNLLKTTGISRGKLVPTPCWNDRIPVVSGKGEPVPNSRVRPKVTAHGGDILQNFDKSVQVTLLEEF